MPDPMQEHRERGFIDDGTEPQPQGDPQRSHAQTSTKTTVDGLRHQQTALVDDPTPADKETT